MRANGWFGQLMEDNAYAGHCVSMLVKKGISHRGVLILVDRVSLSIG